MSKQNMLVESKPAGEFQPGDIVVLIEEITIPTEMSPRGGVVAKGICIKEGTKGTICPNHKNYSQANVGVIFTDLGISGSFFVPRQLLSSRSTVGVASVD